MLYSFSLVIRSKLRVGFGMFYSAAQHTSGMSGHDTFGAFVNNDRWTLHPGLESLDMGARGGLSGV